jgi:hypothetical protein
MIMRHISLIFDHIGMERGRAVSAKEEVIQEMTADKHNSGGVG